MTKRAETRQRFINAIVSLGQTTVTTEQIKTICADNDIAHPYWFTNDETNRVKRGVYRVPGSVAKSEPVVAIEMNAQVVPMTKPVEKSSNKIVNVQTDLDTANLVPVAYKNYVPFGNFEDVSSIVKSMRFFPVFISGHSGNGKTMSIEQACAKAKRKFVCVSMTPETDESDLLGNYVLIDGNMEWRDGPVTTAARQGAVLCIDEIDYGAQNLSSLQRVLEGKPFMLKKKGELITPAPGFTVFATANTKGKGSDDGRYMFTNVLNEAFLERFRTTMEQEFPPVKTERKIIEKELASVGRADDEFAEKLVMWADVIRKTFADGGCDEVISTRRLVHIVETYGIFGDKMKALTLCLNRFDDDTKGSFLDLYTKVDAGATPDQILAPVPEVEPAPADGDEIPF
jgi:hypothetical protein